MCNGWVCIFIKKKIIHLSDTDLNQRSQLFSRGMQIKTHMWTHWLKRRILILCWTCLFNKQVLNFTLNSSIKKTLQILHWTVFWTDELRWIEKNSYFTVKSSFQHMLSTWNPIQIVLVLEVFWGQQHFNKYF